MSDRRRETLRWLMIPIAGAAVMVVGQALGPSIPAPPLAAFALSFSCVCALVLGSARACPARQPRDLRWLIAPISILALVALSGARDVWHAAAVLISLLVAGSVLGTVVGVSIEHIGQLLFVAIVSSFADAASVLHPKGPSAAIVESEAALSLLALPFAFLGSSDTPPLLGVGDAVFASLYVAAGHRHGLPQRRTLLALALAFAATMITVAALEIAIPALPFLGLAMLIAHPQARRPPEPDRARGFGVIGALALALACLWLFGR
jgi:hypothetical protein